MRRIQIEKSDPSAGSFTDRTSIRPLNLYHNTAFPMFQTISLLHFDSSHFLYFFPLHIVFSFHIVSPFLYRFPSPFSATPIPVNVYQLPYPHNPCGRHYKRNRYDAKQSSNRKYLGCICSVFSICECKHGTTGAYGTGGCN